MTEDSSGRTTKGGRESESPLPLDTVFSALANRRRRMILYHLSGCTYPVPFKELVDTVAVQESEVHAADVSAEVYERVALDLHHIQLPKLVEWGVIDYNKRLRLVAVAESLRPLDEYLHLAKQHDQQQVKLHDQF